MSRPDPASYRGLKAFRKERPEGPLGRHRGAELRRQVGAKGAQSVQDGEIGADPVHQRRLAHRLGAQDPLRRRGVFEKGHGHFGSVVDVGYFVGGQAVGQDLPLGRDDELLARHPADPLHEGALDLPEVDGRIETAADVVHDLDRIDAGNAAQPVDGRFDQGRADGVVGERTALLLGLVEVDARCGIARVGRKRDAAGVGPGYELLPGRVQPFDGRRPPRRARHAMWSGGQPRSAASACFKPLDDLQTGQPRRPVR